ncbi:MAG: hypothetical protein JKX87_01130 [Cycloclasticus sp.]|nr:hypothetical protein [Cycloclasticus sp.]
MSILDKAYHSCRDFLKRHRFHMSEVFIRAKKGCLKLPILRCKKLKAFSLAFIEDIINYLCVIGEHRKVHFLWRPNLKDPSDDFVLELAVESECSYIVTYNIKDFYFLSGLGINQFIAGGPVDCRMTGLDLIIVYLQIINYLFIFIFSFSLDFLRHLRLLIRRMSVEFNLRFDDGWSLIWCIALHAWNIKCDLINFEFINILN